MEKLDWADGGTNQSTRYVLLAGTASITYSRSSQQHERMRSVGQPRSGLGLVAGLSSLRGMFSLLVLGPPRTHDYHSGTRWVGEQDGQINLGGLTACIGLAFGMLWSLMACSGLALGMLGNLNGMPWPRVWECFGVLGTGMSVIVFDAFRFCSLRPAEGFSFSTAYLCTDHTRPFRAPRKTSFKGQFILRKALEMCNRRLGDARIQFHCKAQKLIRCGRESKTVTTPVAARHHEARPSTPKCWACPPCRQCLSSRPCKIIHCAGKSLMSSRSATACPFHHSQQQIFSPAAHG